MTGTAAVAFTVHDCEQRSDEWHALRLGRLTSSRAADMLARLKNGKETAGRRNLRVELALERVTGQRVGRSFVSWEMQVGIEREPDASALYEALTGEILQRTGFLVTADGRAGCSLDGHVGDFEGIVEIKSPLPATHLDYLRTGAVPGEYLAQIWHQLWVTDRARWADFISYNPDFPERLRTKIVRVPRDEGQVAAYALAAALFLREVDELTHEVHALAGLAGEPVF